MPYPPPPGPPDVGEFQAIGKLPAPQLPDVTGHGGDFLETDGVIPQWEPVTGVLPDQTGHAGEFLTTDGAVASWAPGGGGITTIGALTTPTADGAIISGGNTLQLAPADATNPGVASVVSQAFSGLKSFRDGAQTLVYDITNPKYGAVPDDPTNDAYQAYKLLLADLPRGNSFVGIAPFGKIYFPEGTYYFSQPVVVPGFVELYGDGNLRTVLSPGIGNSGTPSNVQTFSGPLIYVSAPLNRTANPLNYPQYGAPLVGATGQSMVLDPLNPTTPTPAVLIGDCWPWTKFLDAGPTAVTLQCWVTITSLAASQFAPIVGTVGPYGWSTRYYNGGLDTAIQLYAFENGGIQLGARITTSNEGQLQITSGVLGPGTYNLELDFGGGNFDLYVDGVRVGRLSATGTIVRRPWEGATIGSGGTEWVSGFYGPTGAVDSIRLSNVVRNSVNFTPPTSKYTADANTLWLCNMDQGDAPGGDQPFFVAQSVTPDSAGGLTKHYCRLAPTPFSTIPVSSWTYTHDLGISARQATAGLVAFWAFLSRFERIRVDYPNNWGVAVFDTGSFYCQILDVYVLGAAGIGVGALGDLSIGTTAGCGIGLLHRGGVCSAFNDQPNNDTFISMVMAMIGSAFSTVIIDQAGIDAEQPPYGRYRAGCLFWLGNDSSLTSTNSAYDVSGGESGIIRAVILYSGAGHSTHIGDGFFQNPILGIPYVFEWANDQPPERRITLKNCRKPYDSFNIGWSARDDFLSIEANGGWSGAAGLSTSIVLANNLAGVLYVPHGFTEGVASFLIPEVDTNYRPVLTYAGYLGSAPAAGSTEIVGITKATTDFRLKVALDPGGTSQLIYNWHLIRTPNPVAFDYEPALPSSSANPYSGASNDFAVGVTVVPSGANSLIFNSGGTEEEVLESGTIPSTGGWQLNLLNGGGLVTFDVSTAAVIEDAYVSSVINGGTGKLRSMLSPGAHRLAMVYQAGVAPIFYIDNEPVDGIFSATFGPQAATVLFGQHAGGTNLLTVATLRNYMMGRSLSEVVTGEPDVGPGAMPQNCFFGDDITLGNGANSGSFASQIAIARYGTLYYWIAAKMSGRYVNAGGYGTGILNYFWQGWGHAAGLGAMCLQAGTFDIVTDVTAVDTWAAMKSIIEGGTASSTFTPNTQNTFAWGHLYCPNQVGVPGSFTLQGVVLNLTGVADTQAGSTTLKNLIDGTPALAAIVTTQVLLDPAQPGGGRYYVNVQAIVPGSPGNAITLTYDGGGGELLWTGPTTTGVTLGGGVDATVTITPAGGSPVTLLANFDTDADTTVNNIISLFNAEATLTAVATATLVNHKMVVTANSPGSAGNNIGVTRNAVFTQSWSPASGPGPNSTSFLNGGYDGGVQLGVSPIVICTVPPFGTSLYYTAGREVERAALNVLISNYAAAHPADVTLADLDATLKDGGTPINLNPAYDSGNGLTINDAGQTAVYGVINPLLP